MIPSPPSLPRPLGRNQGRYRGERIALPAVLEQVQAAALHHGWQISCFGEDSSSNLLALHRRRPVAGRRLYVSAGIHGDEPAGPLALEQLITQNLWPDDAELWVCPCLNPTGFGLNQRESRAGVDLNRDYRVPSTPEIRAHVRWLESVPRFHQAVCLHEDWEARGFYLYELNPDGLPSRAEAAVAAAAEVCPLDASPVIEGRPAQGGVIRPAIDPRGRPDWPEAFYLLEHKTPHSYTLEAPSDYALAVRVAALVRATMVLLA